MQTMVNEKFRENVPAWTGFAANMDKFPAFFSRVVSLQNSDHAWQTHERVTYLLFFIHAFQSLEQEAVRTQALKLVSLPLWHLLSRGRLQVSSHCHSILRPNTAQQDCLPELCLDLCESSMSIWITLEQGVHTMRIYVSDAS
jgi:hypothetical protein